MRLSQDFGVIMQVPSDYLLRAVGQRLEIDEVLRNTSRIVLLGDPGSGKSTLLKYLVVICAEAQARDELGLHADRGGPLLPVFVPLREFARECLKRDDDYSLMDYFYTSARERLLLRLPPGFFEEALDAGRCLVCLDGLDEVWAVGQRQVVSNAVKALAARYPRSRYVVTSRLVGYEEAPLDHHRFVHHTILPLDDEDVREFVRKWYAIREHDAVKRQDQIKSLIGTIERELRIQTLARNPLLLTIIALVHRIEAELPHERVKLYDKCVTALVDTWEEVKGLSLAEKQRPFFKYRRRLLERLAFELHTRAERAGDDEAEAQMQMVKSGDLELLLARFLMEMRRLDLADDPDAARGEAQAFIRLARDRTGLLVERGESHFAFSHLTFQEYLAACDIENRCIHRGVDALWEAIAPYLHDSHWREVILLLLGGLNKYDEPPTLLVEKILEAGKKDKFEPVLHRCLFLAACALADRVDVATRLHQRIVDDLLRIVSTGPFWERRDTLDVLSRLRDDDYADDGLLALARDGGLADNVRSEAAQALGQLGCTDQAVLDSLLTLANDEGLPPGVRRAAAEALGQLDQAEQGTETLLALAFDESLPAVVRYDAAQALGRLGHAAQAAEVLLTLACNKGLSTDVRRNATEALGQLGYADGTIFSSLLALARDDALSLWGRRAAVKSLGQLGSSMDVVLDGLLTLARDETMDVWVRSGAAEALGHLGFVETAAEILLPLTCDEDLNAWDRRAAVQALGQLGCAEDAVLNDLLALARDRGLHMWVRRAAADALGQIGCTEEVVLKDLLSLARDENLHSAVRRAIAEALGRLGCTKEAANILLTLTSNKRLDHGIRIAAAQALGRLGRAEGVDEILWTLASDEGLDVGVRRYAVQALGTLGHVDGSVMDGLLTLTSDRNLHATVRYPSYQSLKRLLGESN